MTPTCTHISACVCRRLLLFFSSFLSYQASVSRASPNGKPQNKANPEGRVAALPHHHPDSAVTSHADCAVRQDPCTTLLWVLCGSTHALMPPVQSFQPHTSSVYVMLKAEAFSAGRALESPRSKLILQLRKLRTGGKRSCSRSPSPSAAMPRFLPSSANSLCSCARLPLMSCFSLLQQHKASIDRNQ